LVVQALDTFFQVVPLGLGEPFGLAGALKLGSGHQFPGALLPDGFLPYPFLLWLWYHELLDVLVLFIFVFSEKVHLQINLPQR
jgi:hypothetical protein